MKEKNLLLGLMILLLLSSCASRKKFVYLQDLELGEKYKVSAKHEAVIHCDDRLSITVSSNQPELAIPFNVDNGMLKVNSNGEIASANTSSAREKGYRVDVDGKINFPILGEIHVEGLTVGQLTEKIQNLIIEGNYIKNPLVSIEFLNFKYTVLGAAGRTGTFNVTGDRITLLEAIANAGDINTRGRIDNVAVIRESGGEIQVYNHDLRSKEIFDSPCFYLQQNDIVYVEPKYMKKDNEEKSWQFFTALTSIASIVVSLLWVLK
jgi:polysaccharide export outer membrane protein